MNQLNLNTVEGLKAHLIGIKNKIGEYEATMNYYKINMTGTKEEIDEKYAKYKSAKAAYYFAREEFSKYAKKYANLKKKEGTWL